MCNANKKGFRHNKSHSIYSSQLLFSIIFIFCNISLLLIVEREKNKPQLTRLKGNKNWQVKDLQDQRKFKEKKKRL